MIVKGNIIPGVLRGVPLIERYLHRLRNVLGFAPFLGTLNIKIEKAINMKDYETKRLDHILLSGRTWIDVRLAPASLYIRDGETLNKIDCWIIREEKGVHYPDVVEIVAKDDIKKTMNVEIGTEVELEIHKVKRPRYEKYREKIKSLIFQR
ncbi:MAG: DUF120 domain-containing protein [Candidatus Aenigmarchaeota archaeon]|nr:DUF120 domain-containing protein [Candidatus Aenigmarchaeota archaeon]